jgi:hypothetical protein
MTRKRKLSAKQIIANGEKEGMTYKGQVSRKTTPHESAQVDVWGDQAMKKLKMLFEIQHGETIYVFETGEEFYTEVPKKKGYARHRDAA